MGSCVVYRMAHHLASLLGLLLLSVISVSGQGETAKIIDGVYGFNLGAVELPYTSMFVVTGDGVMVVDPINSDSARAMIKEIRKVTNEPIKYVFYSHDHWDHTSGGQVFKNEGAQIIAHQDANDWIKLNQGADQIPADRTWSGSKKNYRLGRFTMELYQFGPSHGNGMTIFVASSPSQPGVAYIADLGAVKSTGPVYLPDFDTKGWENTLEKTLDLDFELVVFTHSPPQGGTKQDLADHLGYIKDIRAGVKSELQKGVNPFAIPQTLKLDKYKDWAGYDTSFGLNVLHFAIEIAVLGPYASPKKRKIIEKRGWTNCNFFKNSFTVLSTRNSARTSARISGDSSLWNEVVPEKLSSVPPQVARLRWGRSRAGLGDTVKTGQMAERPVVSWNGDSSSLYTVIIVDQGIERLEGKQFIHWMVTNIPGSNIEKGAEVMQYIEPFSFEFGSNGQLDPNGKAHPMLVLVYKQPGTVEVEEIQRGCSPTILTDRINDKDALAAKYKLQLVAGTFIKVPYSPGPAGTEKLLCRTTKCTKSPFPSPLPGINDKPECAPDTRILGQFRKGPKLSQLAEYGKAISIFNPESITSVIKSTKNRGISTGINQEYNALYGIFKAPP